MQQTTNRALSLLLVLALCFSLLVVNTPAVQATEYVTQWWEQYQNVTEDSPEYNPSAPGVDPATGKVTSTGEYILFTSDTHSNTYLAKDLLAYANTLVQDETGNQDAYVGLFAFGGDYADSGLLPEVMTMLHVGIEAASPNTVAVYTKGNHESSYDDDAFRSITGMPRVGETAINENYHFYSFGMTENQTFTQDDIDALETYLKALTDTKPVFVISHFPIHYLNAMRSTYDAGAKELLDVLNQYPQVVFSWGHNHSEADPSYGTVRFPGETLTYGPDAEDTVELNFTYMSNGSLRYSNNEENGVLVKVNSDGSLTFRFICLDLQIADDRAWTDSTGTEFETQVPGEPYVKTTITRDEVDSEYYQIINSAQAFVARPKVGGAPATVEEVKTYSQRYQATDIAWAVDGSPFEGSEFDFSTAYTATVTMKVNEGYTFAEDIVDQHTTGINPSYKGPMGETYSVGVSQVQRVDSTTVKIDYTFELTAQGLDTPVAPATEITEGHRYVLASNDATAVSVYYRYAYQAGARRQSYKVTTNDVVLRDGKLASVPDAFDTYTAIKDKDGYLLYSDASLVAHEDGDNSITTINLLNIFVRGAGGELETSVGEIYLYNNWYIDENGLPYTSNEGVITYPKTTGTSIAGTNDPAECNMRLYDVGVEDETANHYIVEANVTAPVTGATPVAENEDGNPVVWSPADAAFQPATEYTATVTVPLDAPLADANAAIARMNGMDVDLTLSEDGTTATVSYTFPATNKEPVPATDKIATKATGLEDGKTYIILVDGVAMTSRKTDDGRFLLSEEVTVSDNKITEGITTDMLFTVEEKSEDLFYIAGSEGYLIGRMENADAKEPFGITFTDSPAMTITYEDGALYTLDTGVKVQMFGPARAAYFYLYDGHINDSSSIDDSVVEIYEVSTVEPAPENPFEDVAEDKYYYEPVMWAVENGVTVGTSDTTFSPNNTCTRAEALTFLWRANGSPKATIANPFEDVTKDDYYYDAVLWAVEKKITFGVDTTHFAPDRKITRAEMITFTYRAAGAPAATAGSKFSDVSATSYYAAAVAWGVENEIVCGKTATTFAPKDSCTRAQAVTFLYRYYGTAKPL